MSRADYRRREWLGYCWGDVGLLQVRRILFVHTAPINSIRHEYALGNEYRVVFWPPRSSFQHDEGTSCVQRNRARTFCCSSLGNCLNITASFYLQFLDYTCLFCIELHAPCHFRLVISPVCDASANVPTPAFLNMNGRILYVFESPLHPEHAPVGLNVECGFALFLSLLLCFAIQK